VKNFIGNYTQQNWSSILDRRRLKKEEILRLIMKEHIEKMWKERENINGRSETNAHGLVGVAVDCCNDLNGDLDSVNGRRPQQIRRT